MKVEDIHSIYTHITGRAEGMVMAGGEADFPVMFAKAILDYYKKPWVGLTAENINQFEVWFDDEEERKGWVDPALIAKYFEAKIKDKNT